MEDFKMPEPLVLAQGPINRYVVVRLPEPLPEYEFVLPAPLSPWGYSDIDVISAPAQLRLHYRFVMAMGSLCIFEYVGWKYEGAPDS